MSFYCSLKFLQLPKIRIFTESKKKITKHQLTASKDVNVSSLKKMSFAEM